MNYLEKVTNKKEKRQWNIYLSTYYNYYYNKFLGLDLNCNELKYSMAIDLNKFKKIEYIFLLKEIKSVLA